jgi:hypothetical protein
MSIHKNDIYRISTEIGQQVHTVLVHGVRAKPNCHPQLTCGGGSWTRGRTSCWCSPTARERVGNNQQRREGGNRLDHQTATTGCPDKNSRAGEHRCERWNFHIFESILLKLRWRSGARTMRDPIRTAPATAPARSREATSWTPPMAVGLALEARIASEPPQAWRQNRCRANQHR